MGDRFDFYLVDRIALDFDAGKSVIVDKEDFTLFRQLTKFVHNQTGKGFVMGTLTLDRLADRKKQPQAEQ
jgi:hypothetical protein